MTYTANLCGNFLNLEARFGQRAVFRHITSVAVNVVDLLERKHRSFGIAGHCGCEVADVEALVGGLTYYTVQLLSDEVGAGVVVGHRDVLELE